MRRNHIRNHNDLVLSFLRWDRDSRRQIGCRHSGRPAVQNYVHQRNDRKRCGALQVHRCGENRTSRTRTDIFRGID